MKRKLIFFLFCFFLPVSLLAENCPEAAKKIKEGIELDPSILNRAADSKQQTAAILEKQKLLFEDAIKLCDHFSDAHYNLGVIYLRNSEPEKAVAELNKAIELAEQGPYFIARGSAEFAIGNYQSAKNDYEKALALIPDSSEALIGLGTVADIDGDDQEAEAKFREAIKADPLSRDAFYNLGLILLRNGEMEDAEGSFQSALSGDSGFYPARIALAELYIEKKDYAQAERTLKATTLINPKDSRAWILLGKSYQEQNRFEDAISIMEEGKKQALEKENISASLALMRYQTGQKDQAISELKQLTENQPEFVLARDFLAWIYLQEGSLEEALIEIKKGLELDPVNARLHNNYGALLEKKKEYQKAVSEYQRALELNPKLKEAKANLKRIKEKL